MLIKVFNNLDITAPYSYLSSNVSSGGGTLPVKNINAFSASWAIQVGKTGEEQSEVKVLAASVPSGTALIITGTTTFDHVADTPVYALKFDKVIFKRSTTGTAGVATAMTNGTVTITPDGTVTIFDDTTGAASYAYKTQFYNSVTAEVSDESDWITSDGFSFYSKAKIRERIKNKLFKNNIIQDDTIIDDWINEWLEKMGNTLIDVNKDYLIGTTDVSFGTNGLGTITSSDFKEVRRFWVTFDGVGYAQSTKMNLVDFYPTETFNTTRPFHFFQGDDVFGVKPEQAGTARLSYYKRSPLLVDDTDELPVSMRSYTKSFVDYGLAQAFYLDEKDQKGDRFLASAETERALFKKEMAGRSKSGPQMITMTEAVDAEEGYLEIQ